MFIAEGNRGGGRGQEAGEQGAGSGSYMRAGSGRRNKDSDSLLFITGYYLVKNTLSIKVLKFPFNIHQRPENEQEC